MKKRAVTGIVLALTLLTACTSKGSDVSEVQETVKNPEVVTTEATDTGEDSEKGEKEYYDKLDDVYLRIPLCQEKVKGIPYMDDYIHWLYGDMSEEDDPSSYKSSFAKKNQPAGTGRAFAPFIYMHIASEWYFTRLADGSEAGVGDKRTESYEQLKIDWAWNKYLKDDSKTNIVVDKVDVQAFTFTLYEHMVEIPGITMSLYGVDEQTMYSAGVDGRAYVDSKKLYSDYLAGSDCITKLGSYPITQTCIKYVDYKELTKGVDYKNILVVIEVDKQIDNWSFYIQGGWGYNISDEASYNAWKEEHKEAFLQ